MEKIITPKVVFLILSLATFLIIKISPSFFPYYLPDSYDYIKIENSFDRKLFYTFFFIFTENTQINLVNFQILILSLSISYLTVIFFFISKNKIFTAIIFFSLAFNVYYTSFSKVVLPESIFFSLINFTIGLMVTSKGNKNLKEFLLFGLLIGLIAITKKIGIVFSIIFTLYFFHKNKSQNCKLITLSIIFLVIIFENIIFYKYHNGRGSVVPTAVLGKFLFISGSESFKPDNYQYLNKFKLEVPIIQNKSRSIHNFLNTIDNRFIRAELQSDYEVVLQYQNIFELDNFKEISTLIKDNHYHFFFEMIKNNPIQYLEIFLNHYIGMWAGGGKFFPEFVEKLSNDSVPFKSYLKNSSSEMKIKKQSLIMLSHYLFILLFLIFLSVSILSLIRLLIDRKFDIVVFLLIACNLYLCIVAFVNVSTIRYLMPIYPIVSFVILTIISKKVLVRKCAE